MTRDLKATYDVERYRPLGLLGNPFALPENASRFSGFDLEITAEASSLLGKIVEAADQTQAKPIVVSKSDKVSARYPLQAVGLAERSLATDLGIDVLHAYVPFFMTRFGRVRSIISVLSERLMFFDFDTTLERYVAKVLESPDPELIAHQVLGQESLTAFAERFAADPHGVTLELFRGEEIERHPELAQLADGRFSDLPSDVDEDESLPELDSTIGDAPANAMLLAETGQETEDESDDQALVDYIIEYTKVHLSPVVARALRVYRERGQVAAIEELKVTKAPKKTLAAIVRLARVRFKKVALIFDGYDAWPQVPADLKTLIASSMSEVRWMFDEDAVMVFMLERGGVPELEEQFGGGVRVDWDFPGNATFVEDQLALSRDVIDSWLVRAAYPGARPLTLGDSVLAELFDAAENLEVFALLAGTAIESAAERGLSALDAEALEAAKTASADESSEATE